MKTTFTEQFNLEFPLVMAPMFLVSNYEMVSAGMKAGIMATFPSLNFRKEGELEELLKKLNEELKSSQGSYGVNLIVQSTNPSYKKHLAKLVSCKVPFVITSLGKPTETIEAIHSYGGKVYCDVTNLKHAQKCFDAGADGFVAVGQGAGGHAGDNPLQVLVPALKEKFPELPILAAGGIATGASVLSVMALGAEGAYIGTRFIASEEATVSSVYKSEIVKAGMDNIVMSDKLSGTPCAIIDTPYARKIGYKQNMFERWLNKNRKTKKYFKMFLQVRGMKKLQKSILPNNYHGLFTAGKSSQLINEVLSVEEIVKQLQKELVEEYLKVKSLF